DVAGADVERKRAESLNRIYQINAAVTMTDLANRLNVGAIAAKELDKADGEQSGATARFVDTVEGVGDGEPGDGNALLLEALPGIEVGRKFLNKCYNPVARFPVQSHSDGGDAFGGILDQRDLGAVGVNEPGSSHAKAFVCRQPLVIV